MTVIDVSKYHNAGIWGMDYNMSRFDMSKYHNAGIWSMDYNISRFMFKTI